VEGCRAVGVVEAEVVVVVCSAAEVEVVVVEL
jgi:hypothetical protein